MCAAQTEAPAHVLCREFLLNEMKTGLVVLDVGCGEGELMSRLADRGCSVSGVEIDHSLVQMCRASGLQVVEGRAESLPLAAASVDAIVCSVVLPYTDERRVIAEWNRVLESGGGRQRHLPRNWLWPGLPFQGSRLQTADLWASHASQYNVLPSFRPQIARLVGRHPLSKRLDA